MLNFFKRLRQVELQLADQSVEVDKLHKRVDITNGRIKSLEHEAKGSNRGKRKNKSQPHVQAV